jgi:subtilase family serine protease
MRRTNFVRTLVGVGAVALLAATLAAPALASGSVSVAGRPTWATGARLVGHASRTQRVDLAMVLGFRDPAGLDALTAAVSNPRSPSYGQYLTPAQFHARFSPSTADVDAVVSWLRGHGMRVTSVPANHLLVYASGTVAQAEAAFGTALNDYRVGARTMRAPAASPAVPSSLAGIVNGVVGLAQTEAVPMALESPNAPPPYGFRAGKPCSTYWGEKIATNKPKAYGSYRPWAPCGYTPQQIQGAYGVDKVIASGIDGSGQTVAVIDAFHAPTMKFDLKKYSARHGLPVPGLIQRNATPTVGRHQGKRGWYGEEALDLDAVHSMAPGATILFEGAKDPQSLSLLDRMIDIVDNHRASIITNSYGLAGENDADRNAEEAVYKQAIAEGIGVYFSSGDCGDELDPNGLCGGVGKRRADYPASSPNVTAVGGTSLAVGSSNDYLFETGWGTGVSFLSRGQRWKPKAPGLYLYGGGGGTSRVFNEPDYQKGVVPESLSGYWGNGAENRVVPDVAAVGDPNTGFLVGETQYFHHRGDVYDEYRIGGTSLSSPLFAGMMALANQAAGRDLGFINPALYQLAGSDSFRDIVNPASPVAVVRSNWVNSQSSTQGRSFSLRSMNDTGTLHTTPGYDDVTGLGSPLMTKLVQALSQR